MSGYRQRRKVWQDLSKSLNVLATDTPTTVGAGFLASRAKYTIYIQKIIVEVLTAAAQTLTFQDNNGTPLVVARLPASAIIGDEHVLLDSEEGVPLTEGKNLDIVGAAGVAAEIHVQAYLRPTSARTLAQV